MIASPGTSPLPPGTLNDAAFLREAMAALPVCIRQCGCPDHWHALWMSLKGMGLLRGIYVQRDFLRQFLAPYLPLGGQVMIAGAADTGVLDVLSDLFGKAPAHFTVVDRCEAPLDLVRQCALDKGLSVSTISASLDEARAPQPWDMVFVHYTLSFMDSEARIRMLQHLSDDLSPRGVVVCAVRYMVPHVNERPGATEEWLAVTRQKLASTYGGSPELLAPLLEWLPGYARERRHREATMPHLDTLLKEFEIAGLAVRSCAANPGQTVSATPDMSPPGTILNWIGILSART